jgi:hypothetical protein
VTAVDLATKRCPDCEQTKPLSAFHRNRANGDGHHTYCKPCANRRVKASQEKRRERIGDEAYRAQQREIQRKARTKESVRERGRRGAAARYAALERLRELHASEFERLLQIERYERGLA